MHNLKTNYRILFPIVNSGLQGFVDAKGNLPRRGPSPYLPDNKLITIILLAESLSITSERLLYAKLQEQLPFVPKILSRPQFNRRRRWLLPWIQLLNKQLVMQIDPCPPMQLIVDSMPLPVCKQGRAHNARILKNQPVNHPSIGFAAAHKQYFYGYRLHALTTPKGTIVDAQIIPASVHDIRAFATVLAPKIRDCEVLGDKGYISAKVQLNLFETANITLRTPHKKNMKANESWTNTHQRTRRTIETRFSQLVEQFAIQRVRAKTQEGFQARVYAKIASITCLQVLNIQNDRPMNHLLYALRN